MATSYPNLGRWEPSLFCARSTPTSGWPNLCRAVREYDDGADDMRLMSILLLDNKKAFSNSWTSTVQVPKQVARHPHKPSRSERTLVLSSIRPSPLTITVDRFFGDRQRSTCGGPPLHGDPSVKLSLYHRADGWRPAEEISFLSRSGPTLSTAFRRDRLDARYSLRVCKITTAVPVKSMFFPNKSIGDDNLGEK